MRYDAFLSYSHALDGRLAPALQRGLQRFARQWHRPRALRIFRDETNLATSPHLWGAIESALSLSRYFVLLASPRAATSAWVDREVAWWLAQRPAEQLLIVLTEGRLAWGEDGRLESDALPPALLRALTAEPRFLDLRWARSESLDLSLQHNRFRDAVADLAATLHGRDKDELIGEEVRQHRQLQRFRLAAMTGLVTLTLAAGGTAYWAIQQQREAERQQSIAERNFGTALDAADAVVSEVAATLTDLRGVSKQRVAVILTDAETLFGRLAESGGERRALLDRQAGLLLAFARAYMEMGDPARSLARAEEAMRRLERAGALPGEPTDAALDARRASGLFLLGLAQQALADTATALRTFEQARELYAPLVAREPLRADWLAEYAEAHYYVATLRFQQGDLAAAMEMGEAGMALMRRALALEPDQPRWQRDLAVGDSYLAMGYRLQGRLAEAAAALEEAVALLEPLADADPDNLDLQQSLAVAYQQLGGLLGDRGDLTAAVDRLRRAGTIFAALARRDPSNLGSVTGYGAVVLDLATTLESAGDSAAAATTWAEALAVFEPLLAVNPDSIALNQAVVAAATGLARLGAAGDGGGLATLDSGVAILESLLSRDPANSPLRAQQAALLVTRAGALAAVGQLAAAAQGFDAGIAAYAALIARDPTNAEYLQAQLGAYYLAAISVRDAGGNERARGYFERALLIAEAAAKRAPDNEVWAEAFEQQATALTWLLIDSGEGSAAATLRQRRLVFLEVRLLAKPESPRLLGLSSSLRVELGWADDAAGRAGAARAHFSAALALAERLVAAAPPGGQAWRTLAIAAEALALRSAGMVAERNFGRAIAAYRAALPELGLGPDLAGPIASSLHLRARVLFDLGRLDEARTGFAAAALLHEVLAAGGADRAHDLVWLARDRRGLAKVLERQGDLPGATAASAASAAAFALALGRLPDDAELARSLAEQHDTTARLSELRGDLDGAAAAYVAAAAAFDHLLLQRPDDEESRLALAYLLRLAVINDLGRGALAEARGGLDRAFALIGARDAPDDAGLWIELRALLLAEDARLRWRGDDRAGAVAGFGAALNAAARLQPLMPDSDPLAFFILQNRRWLVQVLLQTGDRAGAAALLATALAEGEALAARRYDTGQELDLLRHAAGVLAAP